MPEATARTYASLAENLAYLSSEPRLALLHLLRTPRALSEIRLHPSLSRAGERPERTLSRQAVTHQLEQLLEAGLVLRAAGEGGDLYVLNHERLFALVDEVRGLARLRPTVALSAPGETLTRNSEDRFTLPPGPRIVVAYGRDEGEAFSLTGSGPWSIGRAPGTAVRLDYDPFVSSEHAVVERVGREWALRDVESRNGTWVNGARLRAGASHALERGDLISVGRSVLVFQVPSGVPG